MATICEFAVRGWLTLTVAVDSTASAVPTRKPASVTRTNAPGTMPPTRTLRSPIRRGGRIEGAGSAANVPTVTEADAGLFVALTRCIAVIDWPATRPGPILTVTEGPSAHVKPT